MSNAAFHRGPFSFLMAFTNGGAIYRGDTCGEHQHARLGQRPRQVHLGLEMQSGDAGAYGGLLAQRSLRWGPPPAGPKGKNKAGCCVFCFTDWTEHSQLLD